MRRSPSYKNGDFWDLCAGPHVAFEPETARHFKIMSGGERLLQRATPVQPPASTRSMERHFKNKTELNEPTSSRLEEAKQRDHRKLGKRAGPVSHRRGWWVRGWSSGNPRGRSSGRNYRISSPLTSKGRDYQPGLYSHISGNSTFIVPPVISPTTRTPSILPIVERDNLLGHGGRGLLLRRTEPIDWKKADIDGFLLKPMNCPHHIKVFQSNASQSYRDLAGSTCRIWNGVSLRTVRRTGRNDPGPGIHPGRRPPLLHRRPGGAMKFSAAWSW